MSTLNTIYVNCFLHFFFFILLLSSCQQLTTLHFGEMAGRAYEYIVMIICTYFYSYSTRRYVKQFFQLMGSSLCTMKNPAVKEKSHVSLWHIPNAFMVNIFPSKVRDLKILRYNGIRKMSRCSAK